MVNRKGVTLAEILVCLAILSTLTAIAYPPLRSWSQQIGFRSEVALLVGYLQRAKIEAIKTNSYVAVQAGPAGYSIFVDNSSAPGEAGDWIRQAGERLVVDHHFNNGRTLGSNFPKNRVRFHSSPAIKAGRFILTDTEGRKMEVILDAVGRIRVE
jgi:prepilin-type N-terminal cleavage/methylation domain-containing protein